MVMYVKHVIREIEQIKVEKTRKKWKRLAIRSKKRQQEQISRENLLSESESDLLDVSRLNFRDSDVCIIDDSVHVASRDDF